MTIKLPIETCRHCGERHRLIFERRRGVWRGYCPRTMRPLRVEITMVV